MQVLFHNIALSGVTLKAASSRSLRDGSASDMAR